MVIKLRCLTLFLAQQMPSNLLNISHIYFRFSGFVMFASTVFCIALHSSPLVYHLPFTPQMSWLKIPLSWHCQLCIIHVLLKCHPSFTDIHFNLPTLHLFLKANSCLMSKCNFFPFFLDAAQVAEYFQLSSFNSCLVQEVLGFPLLWVLWLIYYKIINSIITHQKQREVSVNLSIF